MLQGARTRGGWVLLCAAVVLATACGEVINEQGGSGEGSQYPSERVSIMAPAEPGGGWDTTARTMQSVLKKTNLAEPGVQVFNVEGAGGTVGLAQLVDDSSGDPYQLMVMGLVMSGAILLNDSPVTLDQVTPIASLTTEWEAIVVPSDSEHKTLDDLVNAFKADPRGVSWGGGSAGGTDHMLVGFLAKEVGVNAEDVNYVAHSGGGEAIAAILSGAVTAGVSGYSEFADQVDAGKMRLLALSSDKPVEGIDGPTLTEQGYDIVLPNWRGVVAPPDITAENQEAIIAMIEDMRDTPEWEKALEQNGWSDFFKTGDEFAAFIEKEDERSAQILEDLGLVK